MVLTTREPGGTPIGDRVRAILLDHASREMSPEAEVLLFSAAQRSMWSRLSGRIWTAGGVVLCDRFADSTMAYQGYGLQMNLRELEAITTFATGGLRPDLIVYLDIDVQQGLERKRREASGDAAQWNRMEAKTLAFHRQVRAGYLAMVAADPGRWLIVDAAQAVPQVQQEIRARAGGLQFAKTSEIAG